MSNNTQAQLIKTANKALNSNNVNDAQKAQMMKKVFALLDLATVTKLTEESTSVTDLAVKLFLARKDEFINANVTIGTLAIAMNHFRKSVETQYKFDFSGLKDEIVSEITKHNYTLEEVKASIAEAYVDMKDEVAEVVVSFLSNKTNEIIDEYYKAHPETGMKKETQATETPVVEVTVVTPNATIDVTPEKTTVKLEHNGKEIQVIDEPAPDLSTPRARFLHRMGQAMDKVESNDKAWRTGAHCHDFDPNANVDACVKYIEEVKADPELNETCKSAFVTVGEKVLAHHTKRLVKEDEARENYDPNSFKFKLLNFFGATAY